MSDIGRTEPLRSTGSHPVRDDLHLDRPGTDGTGSSFGTAGTARPRDTGETHRDADDGHRDPIEAAKDPDNRAKLLLATAAMTLLNLLLLAVVLANVLGPDFEEVTVDGQACVIQTASGDAESTLYCQR
jgi:hypothetical protein